MLSTDEQEVMKVEQFIVASFLLVAVFIQKGTTSSESALENKKTTVATVNGPVGSRSSFSSDFNSCLFDGWPPNVLAGKVKCSGQQLCYGGHISAGKEQALFAVCYNTGTLIPEFTGHFLQSGGETVSPPGILTNPDDINKEWISDTTLGGQVATDADYKRYPQDFPNYSSAYNLVLARGHLTPDGDFSSGADSLTYTTTNCAPQWQPFNGGNWAKLEEGVRNYSRQKNRNLFIFTGTGGRAKNAGKEIKLNGRVLTPKYYWKAVCDPEAPPSAPGTTGQSIVFVAENKPGDISETKVESYCAAITKKNKKQTQKFGVIYCYSLVDAKQLFPDISANLPPFGASCNPDILGNFMNGFLNKVQ